MPTEPSLPLNKPMPSDTTRDSSSDVLRTSALFESLGLGPIDADEDGCFVMRYDEHTSLHFQIVPAADTLKVAISVCTLRAGAMARDLRVVLRANLDAPRAELPGTLSVVSSTRQVLFNAVVPLIVAEGEHSVRPMQPQEFGALLERVLEQALAWRHQLARELGENAMGLGDAPANHSSSHASLEGAHHVIRG